MAGMLDCTEPAAVANAYVTSQGPYASGSVLQYRCVSPFAMTGSPDRLCNNGSWDGAAPTCSNVFQPPLINSVSTAPETEAGTPDWVLALLATLLSAVLLLLVCSLGVLLYFRRRALDSREAIEGPREPATATPSALASVDSPSVQRHTSSSRLATVAEAPAPVESRVPSLALGNAALGSSLSSPRLSVPDVTSPRFVIASVNGTPRIVRNY